MCNRTFKKIGLFVVFYLFLIMVLIVIDTNQLFGFSVASKEGNVQGLVSIYLAILSVGGIGFTWIMSVNKNYNEIVTKARLEWMISVRNELSVFFEIAVDQQNKIQKIKEKGGLSKVGNTNRDNKFKDKYYENSARINTSYYLLRTFFNPQDSKDIEITDGLLKIVKFISSDTIQENDRIKFKKMNEVLTSCLSLYFKVEWEKIKKES